MFKKIVVVCMALVLVACDALGTPPAPRTEVSSDPVGTAYAVATNAAAGGTATAIIAALTPKAQPTLTATVAPTNAPTSAPTATATVVLNKIVSLNYDNGEAKGNCMTTSNAASDPLMANQNKYIAYYICVANSAGQKQSDLEVAIAAIQSEAAAVGAKTLSGKKITLDNETAWLVWIPNASTMDYSKVPNDSAYPASLKHSALGQIWIVPPYAAGVNGRTFQNADYEFWAVAVH